MNSIMKDYEVKDVIEFLKEEIDRIITQYPTQKEGSILSKAQAFEIWFLHQELGIDYSEASRYVLDCSNDCGVDFLYIDNKNREVTVGQCEYDVSWEHNPANDRKAIDTFTLFNKYLITSKLPENINEASESLWRQAKHKINEGFKVKYYYISPKHFSISQVERIKDKSGIQNYALFMHDTLLERGREFLDGQTGMCNFEISFSHDPLKISAEYGTLYIFTSNVKEIDRIVNYHKERQRLRALFASNVRAYLSTKRRSKEIGDAIRSKLKNAPEEFLICNNGITIQCENAEIKNNKLNIIRGSVSNGCQTVMNIHAFFEDNEIANPRAEVLISVVEIRKNASRLASDIAISRNFQNPVDNRDLMSNNFRLVCLHHRLSADKIVGSEKRYYLLRKQGEKQTILKEAPHSKGQYMWIDSDRLARYIAAVIRQEPFLSYQGTNDLFGRYFNMIFPDVSDPSHTRCKYCWWLAQVVDHSFIPKAKWKGIKDKIISNQRDFKSPALYSNIALLAKKLKDDFSFDESLEKRFVEKAEKWWFKSTPETEEFKETVFEMIENGYRLLYALSKTLLGKELPRAREPYSTYDDFFKGHTYDLIVSKIKKNEMKTYQERFYNSMKRFVKFLKEN